MLTGDAPDPRLREAVVDLRPRRSADGTWPLDWRLPGRARLRTGDGPGRPSRFVTLRGLRILRWRGGAMAA